MSLDLLWTDKCFLLVVLLGLFGVLWSMRKSHIRRAYKDIYHKPIAVSAAIILLFFLIIAVLDSISFKKMDSYQSASLLDFILAPIGEHYEKTYSEPFALNLYSSETKIVNGQVKQVYPRLKYPPKKLQTNSDVRTLTWHVLFQSFLLSMLGVVLVWFLMVLYRFKINKAWRLSLNSSEVLALLTFFICLNVLFFLVWMSHYVHVLGTGKIGQDVFYYAVKSIRTGLIIGILTTMFMMPLALLLGISAGYFGGLVDDIIQYAYTTLSSIPGVLLITASVLSMQTYIANNPEKFPTLAQSADARLLALCLILGVTSWTSLCRLLRAETLKLREVDFVLAAKVLGSGPMGIIFKHLLPNVMHIVLITLVLDFSFLVLAEAVLSYVGVGVSPMTLSWGNMINAARLELAREPLVWWPMFSAFLFMFSLVLASNLFADAVRDAFDPRK